MAILSKGTDFTTGDQVTAAKLDALVDNATFASDAVDDSTTQLDSSGRIIVKDGGITSAKLPSGGLTSNLKITSGGTVFPNSPDNGYLQISNSDGSNKLAFDPNEILVNGGGLSIRVPKSEALSIQNVNAAGDDVITNMRIQEGKVGIGDTSPSHELVVKNVTDASTDCFIQVVSGDSSNAGILFGDNSDNSRASIFVENDTDKLFLSSPNTDKALVIDSLEQVGIGTSSPEATLHVNDRYSTGPCILVEDSSSTEGDIAVRSGEALQVGHWDNSASEPNKFIERLRIDSNGQTMIGQTSTPTSVAGSLFVAGRIGSLGTVSQTTSDAANINIASTGLFRKSTSSARYKKNIEDYTKGIDEVKLLRPVSFQSNNEEDDGKTYAGLIAEEVHDAGLTEFVDYNEEGQPDAIHYSNMVSLLTKALQESITKIESLEARVAALES